MAAVTMEDLLQPHLLNKTQKQLMLISRGLCKVLPPTSSFILFILNCHCAFICLIVFCFIFVFISLLLTALLYGIGCITVAVLSSLLDSGVLQVIKLEFFIIFFYFFLQLYKCVLLKDRMVLGHRNLILLLAFPHRAHSLSWVWLAGHYWAHSFWGSSSQQQTGW